MNNWSPEVYQRNAAFVPALGETVLNLLDPQPGEQILDLGCGDGALTARIAERGAAVVGIDRSERMLAAARARGLDVRQADAEDLPFSGEFDAVFSNAVVHWIRNQDAMVEGVRRALKAGGRFVVECGGHGNIAAIQTAVRAVLTRRGLSIENYRYYATDAEYRTRLESHGFDVEEIALIPRPTPLPTGMRGWLETFEQMTLERFRPDERGAVLNEMEDLLRPSLCDQHGNWTADYVRLRFRAVRR